jgi:molybdopterin-guanine dinucleotide biosynthesis protein A
MNVEKPSRDTITGVVLAGGKARRMGGLDKGLVPFAGKPLVEWVIDSLTPQVGSLLISANRNLDVYAAYGHEVVPDDMQGFQGPLAGFASAMRRAATPWITTMPCDGPFPAPDLVARLCTALIEQDAAIAVATDGKRMQPVYALIPVSLDASIRTYLQAGERKLHAWYARHRVALADLGDRPDSFANVNSAEDSILLERARKQ